jgi:predicted DNA-binding protein (MmcQ/YjbR family)
MSKANPLTRAESSLRQFALTFPETYEEFPWGHRALKVKGKVFLFMALEEGVLSLSVKLPLSGAMALTLPFASPTGYGLGKSGWVTARFGAADDVPTDMLEEWVDESFRAVAPKKLVARLENAEGDGEQEAGDEPPAREPKRSKKRRTR